MKRLNKYISDTGFCSRREADALIEQKQVLVNGKSPELGTKIGDQDTVVVQGKHIRPVASNKSDRVYIAYHKPVGITCTTERKIHGNIIDAIKYKQRIFPIGRLDKPSEGLILLTNDGDIVNKILRAENAHDKLYRVTVDKPISESFVSGMSSGVPILNQVTLPCTVKQVGKFSFDMVLQQGLNRQIRRMCEYFGYEVTRLIRKRIMHIDLKGLALGQYRHLTESEMQQMNSTLVSSSKIASEHAVQQGRIMAESGLHNSKNTPQKDNIKSSKNPHKPLNIKRTTSSTTTNSSFTKANDGRSKRRR